MYNISETAQLQVMRRVVDVPTRTVVFHVIMIDDTKHSSDTDYVEIHDINCRGLELINPSPQYGHFPLTVPVDVVTTSGYNDCITNGAEEDAPAEEFLRGLGVLPPEWAPEEAPPEE